MLKWNSTINPIVGCGLTVVVVVVIGAVVWLVVR